MMPDWQPVAVPDLCSRCGAYWECECRVVSAEEVGRTIGRMAVENVLKRLERLFPQEEFDKLVAQNTHAFRRAQEYLDAS